MECLAQKDLVTFLVDKYQNANEKQAVEKHLATCTACRVQLEALKNKIETMQNENETACQRVRDDFMNFLENNMTTQSRKNFESHLAECFECDFIFQQMEKSPSYEDALALNIPIRARLHENIDMLLARRTRPKPMRETMPVLDRLGDFVEKIILTVVPMPQPAFLGDKITGEAQIEATQESLAIQAGKPNCVVKLYSMQDRELDRNISDAEGLVVFEELTPGRYKVVVEGFEIQAVRKM